MSNVFKYNFDFFIESYEFGHSKLTLGVLGEYEDLQVVFEGVHYLELPRILYGFELIQLNEIEKSKLVENKRSLKLIDGLFFRLVSRTDSFYIISLSMSVYKKSNKELIMSLTYL